MTGFPLYNFAAFKTAEADWRREGWETVTPFDTTRTGRMWGAIIGGPDVPPDKVAMCMVALKLSRECNKPKRDNRTDVAGYVKTLELVRERQGLA